MALTQKLLARSVVLLLLLGMLPALQPPAATAQDTATYNLTKYDCSPGYDPGSADASAAFGNCVTPSSGVQFTLTSGDATYPGSTQATDGGGFTGWGGIPLGTGYSITESVPPGYGNPWVYCEISGNPGNPGDVQGSFFQAPGGAMDVGYTDPSLTGYTQANCTWFNIPPAQESVELQPEGGEDNPPAVTTTVTILKQACGFHYAYGGATLAQLQADCPNPLAGATFTIGGEPSTAQTTGNDGRATITDVFYGNLNIQEEAFVGYDSARIFCQAHPAGDANVVFSDADEVAIQDGGSDTTAAGVQVTEGNKVDCLWFNVLLTEPDSSSLIVYKYACPGTYEPSTAAGLDDLSANCPAPVANPSFDLVAGGNSTTFDGDATGTTTIVNAAPGSYAVQQTQPDGYLTVRVFCHGDAAGTGEAAKAVYTEMPITDPNQVDIELQAGAELTCYWFDVQTTTTDSGSVSVYKYACDSGFDWESGGYDYLASECDTPVEHVSFALEQGSWEENRDTDAVGAAKWTDVPTGTLVITEETPSGYQVGRVFCGVSSDESTLPSAWADVEYDIQAEPELESGQYLHCVFFNIPTDDSYPITITKYNCEHFLTRGPADLADFEEHCTEWAENVEFRLYAGMALIDTATTDASGVATLTAPTTGQHQIVETPVGDYLTAAAYCTSSATDDPAQEETFPLLIDVTADYPVTCAWYNAEDVFGEIISDPGTILIHKYDCAPGFPTDGMMGFENLREGCTIPASNITFSVNQGGNQIASGATDSAGEVALEGAAGGATQISELPIADWDPPRVFCASVPVGIGRNLVDYQEQTVTTWGIDYDIQADTWIDCYWFDRPPYEGTDGQPIQIIVHKVVCDPEVNPGDTFAGAVTECQTPEEGVEFTLTGGDAATASGPTDVNGYAEYNGLAPGSIRIAETPRDGYATGAVFCSFSYGTTSSDYELYPVADQTIQTYVAPGYKLECYWYNVVEPDTGHVYIFKYACPEGTSATSFDDLDGACTEAQSNVPFTLEGVSSTDSYTEETGTSGLAAFYDLAVGTWQILETPPSGYAGYAVYCGTSDTAYIPPTTWDSYPIETASSSIEAEVTKDTYLMCTWFNIEAHDDPQVWIYKYDCHEGADWHWDYDQLLSSCTEPAPDVDFHYGPKAGTLTSATTDDQGQLHLDPLAPGLWVVGEEFPSGYSGVVVYCQFVNSNGTGEFQQAAVENGEMWLDLDYGDVVSCSFFDFPDGHAPASPTPSTGSGDSGGTSGPPPLSSNVPAGSGGPAGTTPQQGDPNAPATLIVIKRTCPPGYELYADDADVDQDCDDLTADIDFALTDLTPHEENGTPGAAEPIARTTDDDGEATWDDLAAGAYLIAETLPEETHTAFIWTCQSDQREFPLEHPFTPFSYAGPDGEIGITLIAGETLECAWYDLPEASGSITILKFQCPGSPVVIAQCQPAGAGIEFTLAPIDTVGPILSLTTDDQGTATAEGTGSYTLTEEGDTPCLLDSEAIDDQGHVVVEQGAQVEMKVYDCSGGS